MSTKNQPLKILYEDNHLIAVEKPAGILVQGDETGDVSLLDLVKKYLKEKYQKPGNVFLGLIHRLDRPVSGVIIFARTSKAAARLSEQFRSHITQKIYHALVEKMPPQKSATLVHYLKKDAATNTVKTFDQPHPAALRAELNYEVVKTVGKNTLLKIELKTGRPHQIRAQLATIGCPIVGDLKYGAAASRADRSIALKASSLSFNHPITGERKTVELPITDLK